MILRDARNNYDYCSGKLSDIVRQLSFAGIAVIWIFRSGSNTGGIKFDEFLLWPLLYFVAALACDLGHYVAGSLIWSRYAHCEEKKGTQDDHIVKPDDKINWPTLTFFWFKAAFCSEAYLCLGVFLGFKL